MCSSPNILWICTDQQRWDTLNCYGNPYVTTPHIDRLAASGVRFANAFCQSPVCTPSRASFLTGRYPRTTRCRQNGQHIPVDEVLVTRLLAEAGYVGGLSGKLHLSPANPSVTTHREPRINDGYTEFYWSHTPLPSANLTTDAGGAQSPWIGDDYTPWLRQRGAAYTRSAVAGSPWVQTSVPAELHQTTWCAEMAIDFIQRHAQGDQPWFFSVNPFDPHHAFDPPAEYLQPYLDRLDEIPLPDFTPGELEDKPIFQHQDHNGGYNNPNLYPFSRMNAQDHRLVRGAYWAMIDLIDAQVGRILDALESSGQAENTIVIFMSDHGEMLGDRGIYLKGPYFYEPAIHIPLIVAGPGILAGETSAALVELTDLAPTLLDAAGLPRHPGMQGRSLWPLLTGDTALDSFREDVYCEFYNALSGHKNPQAHATCVRTAQHKIAVYHGIGAGELYDLAADPSETVNRWDDPAYAGVKAEMLVRLCDRMAQTVDPLPPRVAPW